MNAVIRQFFRCIISQSQLSVDGANKQTQKSILEWEKLIKIKS